MSKQPAHYEYVDANIKLSVRQRLDYAIAEFGYNFIYFYVSSYLMIYYTDVIGVAASSVSLLVLVMRLFDAFNDPIIGSIADRTRSPWGRYRPWVAIGGLALAISVVLLFSAKPEWSSSTKVAYMWIVYCAVTIASTCCNMPFGAMNGVLTSNANERVKLSGMRMVVANIGLNGAGVVAIPLVVYFSKAGGAQTANGWFWAVLVCCVISVPTLFWTAAKCREVLAPPPTQNKLSIASQFKAMSNKYIYIAIFTNLLTGIIMYGKMSMITYYYKYVCHAENIMTINSVVALVSAVLGAGVVGPKAYAWLKNKGKVAVYINLVNVILYVILFWFPAPHILFFVINFVTGLGAGASGAIGYSLIPDAIDYGELKTGVRCDGFIASFVSLALKVGGAIGPALGGAALTWFGFVANAEQSATVVIMLNFSVTIIPAICALITLVLYLFYDLDDAAHAKIREELAERRKV